MPPLPCGPARRAATQGAGDPTDCRCLWVRGLGPLPAPHQPPEMPLGSDGNSWSATSPRGSLSRPVPALTSPPSPQVCQRIRRFCPRRGHLHGPGSLARRLLPAPLQHVCPEVGITSPILVPLWLVLPPHPLPPAAPTPCWTPRATSTWTTPWTWRGMWRSCCGAPWTVSGSPMPSRDGQAPGPPALRGLCCVRVSVPGGRRVGPAPEICSVLPRNAGWRPALWCLCLCINGSGFVAWFSCMFLLRGPASAFRFCKHRPRSPPLPAEGLLGAGAGSPASGLLSQSSLRTYVSPSCSTPWLCSQGVRGRTRLQRGAEWGVGRGSPLARAGAPLHGGGGPLLDLVSSSGPPGMREPLRLPASVSPARAGAARGRQGARAPSEGGRAVRAVWGERSPLPPPPPLPSPWPRSSGVLAMLFFYHRVNKARNIFVTQKLWVSRVSWGGGRSLPW